MAASSVEGREKLADAGRDDVCGYEDTCVCLPLNIGGRDG
jgi:hypothetical protein